MNLKPTLHVHKPLTIEDDERGGTIVGSCAPRTVSIYEVWICSIDASMIRYV